MSLHHPDSTPCSFFAAACQGTAECSGKELGTRCQAAVECPCEQGPLPLPLWSFTTAYLAPLLVRLGHSSPPLPPLSPVSPALPPGYGVSPPPIVSQGKAGLLSQLCGPRARAHRGPFVGVCKPFAARTGGGEWRSPDSLAPATHMDTGSTRQRALTGRRRLQRARSTPRRSREFRHALSAQNGCALGSRRRYGHPSPPPDDCHPAGLGLGQTPAAQSASGAGLAGAVCLGTGHRLVQRERVLRAVAGGCAEPTSQVGIPRVVTPGHSVALGRGRDAASHTDTARQGACTPLVGRRSAGAVCGGEQPTTVDARAG